MIEQTFSGGGQSSEGGELIPFTALLVDDSLLTDEQIRSGIAMSFHMRNRWELCLMGFVVQWDRRELFEVDGFRRVEDWLSSFLGIGYRSACTFVRIACALESLPLIKAAFGEGKLTYDHLKALVRNATSENEQALLEATQGKSVSDTYKILDAMMAISPEEESATRSERWIETRWDQEQRMLYLFGQLPGEMGARFEKALDRLAKKMPTDDEAPAMGHRRADALCQMASSVLGQDPATPSIVVHVDEKDLYSNDGVAQIENGCAISSSTVRRLACDAAVQIVVDGEDGQPLALSSNRRTAPRWMLRLLKQRDRTCRFSGCRVRKQLHAHHIDHAEPGEYKTRFDNLVMLCETHHNMVHDSGWVIKGRAPDIWIERKALPPIKIGPPPMQQETRIRFVSEFTRTWALARGPT